uniref:Uncharacterized protein n=1 Tax=Rhizophora mucronata TaxID=61149 RepID=A0A2P2NG16_RHIMU
MSFLAFLFLLPMALVSSDICPYVICICFHLAIYFFAFYLPKKGKLQATYTRFLLSWTHGSLCLPLSLCVDSESNQQAPFC